MRIFPGSQEVLELRKPVVLCCIKPELQFKSLVGPQFRFFSPGGIQRAKEKGGQLLLAAISASIRSYNWLCEIPPVQESLIVPSGSMKNVIGRPTML